LEVGGDRWANGNAEGTVSDVGAPRFFLSRRSTSGEPVTINLS